MGEKEGMRIPVLMYHKVSPGKKEKYRIIPERFTNQMEYLSKKGYQTISPDELLGVVRKRRILPEKSVLLTFDDGYKDNFTYAYPILKKYHFKATIFLVTQYMGRKSEWSKREEETLSWEEIIEMKEEGFSFGSHTHTHPNLLELSRDKVLSEIRDSKKILEGRLGEPIKFFAYPYGKFNSQIRDMVKEAGYLGAFSTLPGKNTKNEDPFLLRRILIRGYDTKPHFILNLKLGRSRI